MESQTFGFKDVSGLLIEIGMGSFPGGSTGPSSKRMPLVTITSYKDGNNSTVMMILFSHVMKSLPTMRTKA